jgi:hypothetical protein
MPAAAIAIPAAVQAGSSILGGILGNSAAKKAAAVQAAAAKAAAGDLKSQLDIYNPQIGAAATTAAQGVTDATTSGQAGIGSAVTGGQGRIDDATARAIALLQPYIGAGGTTLTQLMSGLAPGGDLNKTFTASDMQQYDPGYQFRMDQAAKALQGSAAARGGAIGGGTLSALTGLSQNLASSEFGNAEQRFRAQQTDRFNRLNSLVNLGATSATQAGTFGMTGADDAARLGLTGATSSADLGLRGATGAGTFATQGVEEQTRNALNTYAKIGDLMTGGAAATAGGIVGGTNALTGALSGVSGAVGQVGKYYQDQDTMKDLMTNPALGYIVNPRTGRGYRQ